MLGPTSAWAGLLRRNRENTNSVTRCAIQVLSVSIVNLTVSAETFSSCSISVASIARVKMRLETGRTMDCSRGLGRKRKGW